MDVKGLCKQAVAKADHKKISDWQPTVKAKMDVFFWLKQTNKL